MLAFNFTTYRETEGQARKGFVSPIGGAICTSGPTGVKWEVRGTKEETRGNSSGVSGTDSYCTAVISTPDSYGKKDGFEFVEKWHCDEKTYVSTWPKSSSISSHSTHRNTNIWKIEETLRIPVPGRVTWRKQFPFRVARNIRRNYKIVFARDLCTSEEKYEGE